MDPRRRVPQASGLPNHAPKCTCEPSELWSPLPGVSSHGTPRVAELLATSCSPTLTHIDNHLTPCDTYLITISGRTSSTGVRHTFRFLVFAFWFSILPLVFDSVFFQIFPALPTVPRGPGVPSQAPKLQNFNFLTYTCEPSVTGQGFLGAIIPCTAGNRISRGEPPTSA